jgi:hypothetical protein
MEEISDKELPQEPNKDSDKVIWQRSQIINSHLFENWLPILISLENDRTLGISQAGYWILEEKGLVTPLVDINSMRSVLPFLKFSYDEFIARLEQSLKARNMPIEIYRRFSVKNLLLLALRWPMEYWITLALDWLNRVAIDEDIRNELRSLSNRKYLSQKTRHRALKLSKR